MSQLDFSIPGRALANLPNPAQQYQQALSLKDVMQQAQLRDVQLQDALETRQRTMSLRDTLRGAVSPDGTIDGAKVRAAYAGAGDLEGLTAFNASEAQQAKAQREADAARIKQGIEEHRTIAQLATGAVDEGSWRATLARAKGMGLDTTAFEQMPYSPELIANIRKSALDVTQQLEQEWKAKDYGLRLAQFGETQQQNAFNRQLGVANLGVAQGNLAVRQAEATQGASGMPSPKEQFRDARNLRKDFDSLPEVKDFKAVLPTLISARRAPDNAAGDIQLAYTVGKILDPGSVVREGELAMVAQAGSLMERVLGAGRVNLGNGGRLPANVRAQLLNMLNERALAQRQAYDQARSNYEGYASSAGIDPKAVVGSHPASAFASRPVPAQGNNAPGWSIRPKQ